MSQCRNQHDSELSVRSSIWAIPEGWEGTYFLLFVAQVLAWTSLMTWRTTCCGSEDNIFDMLLAVGAGAAAIMVTSAGSSMIQVEVIVVFAEKYLRKRYADGFRKGEERGEQRGKQRGEQSANAKWEAWNAKRIEAEARGETPPPPPNEVDRD